MTQTSWLAFELNVLRRLKFASAALPFTFEPNLGAYLKRWNARVAANDLTQSGWIKAIAAIENNSEKLSADEVETILEDAYIPGYRLKNAALRNWFNETDAWWFDNVRNNIEKLSSTVAQAVAYSIAMNVGDYVLSFNEETLELRQPLSKVFKRLWSIFPVPVNNGQKNSCQNKSANDFIAENSPVTDLMFLRLPAPHRQSLRKLLDKVAWREEWLQGGDDFWGEYESSDVGKLGSPVETKQQYLHLVEETLRTASHIPVWAIAHVENGFISAQDIAETVGRIRRVDTIFTKDFSELTGAKSVIITA